MNNRSKFLLLLTCLINISIAKAAVFHAGDTTTRNGLPLQIDLPNNHWHLAVSKPPSTYIFKRDPVTNADGKQIIPAIMIVAEDASSYKQDVTIFCSRKMQPFTDRGVKVDSIINWEDKTYPLQFKNALFMQGRYTDKEVDHIIYMIYIIDNHDKGIQVYLDMTKDIAGQYEPEFMKTIKSLQLLP